MVTRTEMRICNHCGQRFIWMEYEDHKGGFECTPCPKCGSKESHKEGGLADKIFKLRKKIFPKSLLLLLLTLFIPQAASHAQGKAISSVELSSSGSWIYVYDSSGHKITTISSSNGSIQGFSSSFFILKSSSGSWYYLYDPSGKRYKTMSASEVGDIISVAGDNFTSRKGSWIYTYDRNGKRINTRAAR